MAEEVEIGHDRGNQNSARINRRPMGHYEICRSAIYWNIWRTERLLQDQSFFR